jgi:A/G-specific adenine glycosylase
MPLFTKSLTDWYHKNYRRLPWRETSDPYKIWISEIMLQQTTVNAVIPYYQRWLERFPTIKHVAKAPLQKILKIWQGLGYYQRAKNIHKCANMVCQEYKGKIPSTAEELKKLPGFGPYTIGAVLSIAFDKRHPIIDANVRRVVMRQLALKGKALPEQDPAILEFLEKVLPQKGINIFNQALMELGAMVCRSRQPACLICPVKGTCQAYIKGIQEIIPEPKKSVTKDVEAVIAVIERDNKFFIQKRDSKGLLADLWEFPGGKIEKGETAYQALCREVREELRVELVSAKPLMNVKHFYTQFRVNLNVFECQPKTYPSEDATHKWVSRQNLTKYPMPSGSAKIVEKLVLSKAPANLAVV